MAVKKDRECDNPNRKLTSSEKQFINLYMIHNFNATKAYEVLKPNVSKTVAGASGWKVKNRPAVLKEIKKRVAESIGDKDLLADEMLRKLKDMSHAKKTDEFYTPAISLKAIDLLQKQLNLITNNVNVSGGLDIAIDWGDEEDEDE